MSQMQSHKVQIRFLLDDPHGLTDTDQHEWTVDGWVGQSILDVAHSARINIEHACGCVCACATCHVYVEEGAELLSEAQEDEEDRVEEAPGLQANSRLSCQCRIKSPGRLVVRVPAWNRNAVKEVPH
jgi:2Fe-2S ferredoxin